MISDCEYNNIKLPTKIYQKIEEKVSMLYVELNIDKMPIDPFDIANRRGYIDCRYQTKRKSIITIVAAIDTMPLSECCYSYTNNYMLTPFGEKHKKNLKKHNFSTTQNFFSRCHIMTSKSMRDNPLFMRNNFNSIGKWGIPIIKKQELPILSTSSVMLSSSLTLYGWFGKS